ncbi:CDC73-domain-containing protein [Lentithecium fluviatile CBS 122367]|uniref:CDC73-domain-containing protein n=1 Tax=Lentithecium fluviatile CBS 122367 TaxID=1168545 RepID=A0A6G1J1C5_9PLEO|nr:CDC73-domain-containing protein [Lentithecium fluviatile CBS 122367]
MATQAELDDPLYNLRLSITSSNPPILTTTPTPTRASDTVTDLAQATHISFNIDAHHKVFPITTPTRFAPDEKPLDLRSIYFAWVNKDVQVTEYFSNVQHLNEELPSGAGGSVQNLSFAQKIELISWLSGETDVSESIAPLEGAAASVAAGDAAAIAGGKGVPMQKSVMVGGQKMVDARLLQIYDGERKMGDHNTALRGSKAIDFSAYRKTAATFLRSRPSDPKPSAHPHAPLVSNLQKKPPRRSEQPIILLSPSASSLLRMSNIKSFLDEGLFIPANATDTTTSNFLQMARLLPSISSAPMRFILVDSTSMFKPSYWSRVVAIFTTGQPWQFKSYKYPNPIELFSHYPGVYVGYEGESDPENVKAWGRGVMSVSVDKWTGSEKGRWRDREVVERIWGRVEEGMRKGGWTREGPGLAGVQGGR